MRREVEIRGCRPISSQAHRESTRLIDGKDLKGHRNE